jgi:SecD/SecF fusion protein
MKGEDGEVAQTIDGDVVQASSIVIMLDDAILSAPTAKEPIDSRDIEITGDFTQKEAAELSMLIRGGALPVVLKAIESGLNTQ